MTSPVPPLPAEGPPAVDARNPWLGLASFTEETRDYFYGREEEVAELARRVQRKLLTVLFGQSGLGKTSILRAGLVPRLRAQGYCPVYVRIDYGRDAPEPALQIKQAIAATARRSGEWTRAGVAVEGESLWEFLHHRDDVLQDEAGKTLIPLLIFDQFEEIFTLAQSDDFGRARAARFVADLADLVENRPPKELEAKLDQDEAAAEQFDFARSDYRVLIALREDYLAPLEGLKAQMPSITQNRLRLAPMTGTQALTAVVRPGGRLVTEEVAAAIVRFVAGGAEIANAEVEPSLLSLICRELNDKRIAESKAEISLDLLAGSHATILAEFYERSLGDQSPAVRRIIEDELLTESGYRENVAEERLVSSFTAAGAAPGTLSLLVNRRLLRIEERLDVRRAELTHDVLCGVVKGSRDIRKEREARDRTERLLADQRDRELAARQALVRARRVAVACALLAVGALVALVFAFQSAQRARRAEGAAQETRAAAETARTQAEHLLGYLNEGFAVELAGFGRLTTLKALGEKEEAYYRSLPQSLQTTDTVRSAALAEVRYGIALQQAYDLTGSTQKLTGAVTALEKLRAAGEQSEGTAIGLALGYSALADVSDRMGSEQSVAKVDDYNHRAVELVEPYALKTDASVAARRAYALVLGSAASYMTGEPALELHHRAQKALESLGALQLTDLPAAADYANSRAYEATELWRLGRVAEIQRVTDQGRELADAVLAQRPGHLVALQARMWLLQFGSVPLRADMRVKESIRLLDLSFADGRQLLNVDPTNVDSRNRISISRMAAAADHRDLGHPAAALVALQQSIDVVSESPHGVSDNGDELIRRLGRKAALQADLSRTADSEATLAEALAARAEFVRAVGADNSRVHWADCGLDNGRGVIALVTGDPSTAHTLAQGLLKRVRGHAWPKFIEWQVAGCAVDATLVLAEAGYELGDYAGAVAAATDGATMPGSTRDPGMQRDVLRLNVWRASALARLGRVAEAERIVTPMATAERARYARNHDDESQRLDFARVLYALALVDRPRHDALLREAAGVCAALPAEMRALKSVSAWRSRIEAELRTLPAVAALPAG